MLPMTRKLFLHLMLLCAFAVNVLADANNPKQPASPVPAATEADPTKDPGVRKLSRREKKDRIAALSQAYRDFLRDVEPIMVERELHTFLLLESDPQRDLYVEEFWRRRDPDPRTAYNEYRENYKDALVEARAEFKHMSSERARIYLTRGRPLNRLKITCDRYLQPLEIWEYAELPGMGHDTSLLFYQPRLGGDYRLWVPRGIEQEDLAELISQELVGQAGGDARRAVQEVFYDSAASGGGGFVSKIRIYCKEGELILKAISRAQQSRFQLTQLFDPPKMQDEDVNRILRATVIGNPTAPKLPAEFSARYPGKRGARTAVEMTLIINRNDLKAKDIEGSRFYNIDITGEVLKDGKMFETYRYNYNFDAATLQEKIPITIERYLRPADYKSRIKITDINAGSEGIIESDIVVPQIEVNAEVASLKAEASETLRTIQDDVSRTGASLRIVPLEGELVTGLQHIETILSGEAIKTVEFYLDGKKVMVKRSPPYALDLDLGRVPQPRKIKAVALDAKGNLLTGDEIVLNTGSDPFRVRIVSPRIAPKVTGKIRVEVDAAVPEGKTLKSLDLFLNETKMATLYAPPFVQSIDIPADLGIAYLRAVATLADSTSSSVEDVVFINTPEFLQEVDVHLVELPTTVLKGGKLVRGLAEGSFKVFDQGQPVKIAKFDAVDNLPLSLGIAIDSSGSMRDRMLEAQRAGAGFLKSVLRKGDRAFVTAFDTEPILVQKWTPSLADLTAGLASLRAEESTALYDAIVFSLYKFQGVKGQKALIVISDGKDTASKFVFDQALEYARRAAIPIYGIGIGIRSADVEVRYKFNKFATETGGNTYFIESAAGLGKTYDEIQNELRSQYVLGFYPPQGVKTGSAWREVRVDVGDGRAKTIRGYYP